MKHKELPVTFCAAVPDDSMMPRVRRGDVLEFDTRETPRSGDGVLVRDDAGRLYFRVYRQGMPPAWEAHPLNSDYLPLKGGDVGLAVVAVMVGAPRHRWG